MAARSAGCPPRVVLADYALGRVADDAATARISAHAETCADCRHAVARVPSDSFIGKLRNALNCAASEGQSTLLARTDTDLDHHRNSRAKASFAAPAELANHPDYELIGEIGRGGMGVVYLAKNRMMDRLEVLKVLNKSLLAKPNAIERFQREVRSAARLNHANVVTAYRVFWVGNLMALAMEHVDGQDLSNLVKRVGPLPVVNASLYAYQAALGLQHAHEQGMIHRDIKPSNLILAQVKQEAGGKAKKRHVIKILDFGLAKAVTEKEAEQFPLAQDGLPGLTLTGQVMGTPSYMAPEQTLDSQNTDIRADIYGLGCTLYFLLAGQPPFRGSNVTELLAAHHQSEAEPLNELRSDVPPELAHVVAKMIAKRREDRYQTPGEVAQALMSFFKSPPNAHAKTSGISAASSIATNLSAVPTATHGPSTTANALTNLGQSAAIHRGAVATALGMRSGSGEPSAGRSIGVTSARTFIGRSRSLVTIAVFLCGILVSGWFLANRPLEERPVPDPPQLAAIENRTVALNEPFAATVTARNPPIPGQQWLFRLLDNAPEGMTIGRLTGSIHWPAEEDRTPGDYCVTVRVCGSGLRPATADVSFVVTVQEAVTVIDDAPQPALPATRAAPVVSVVKLEPSVPTAGNDLIIYVSTKDADGNPARLEYRDAGEDTWVNTQDNYFTLSTLEAGLRTLEVRAIDDQGHTSGTILLPISVVPSPTLKVETTPHRTESEVAVETSGTSAGTSDATETRELVKKPTDATADTEDIKGSKPVRTITRRGAHLTYLALRPDGKVVLFGDPEKATLLDLTSGEDIQTLTRAQFGGRVSHVQFSGDGRYLLATNESLGRELIGRFHALKRQNGRPVSVHDLKEDRTFRIQSAFSATFSSNSDELLIGTNAGTAFLLELASLRQVRQFATNRRTGEATVAISPDGALALVGHAWGTKLYDRTTGLSLHETNTRGLGLVAFSPDSDQFIIGDYREFTCIDVASLNPVCSFALPSQQSRHMMMAVMFTSTGLELLTVPASRGSQVNDYVLLWRCAPSEILHNFPGTFEALRSDIGKLVTVQKDKVTLWDLTTGASICELMDAKPPVAISTDGRLILTGLSADPTTVAVWEVPHHLAASQ